MVKDTKEGDQAKRLEKDRVAHEKVVKVKPDGTRVTKDKTGGLHKQKKPVRPGQPL